LGYHPLRSIKILSCLLQLMKSYESWFVMDMT
jgi:hypothetical protein